MDGDTDPVMEHNHCAHPKTATNKQGWWMVDLGQNYVIENVTVFNRIEGEYDLSAFPVP